MANKNLNKAKEAKKDEKTSFIRNWKISTTSCGITGNIFAVRLYYVIAMTHL